MTRNRGVRNKMTTKKRPAARKGKTASPRPASKAKPAAKAPRKAKPTRKTAPPPPPKHSRTVKLLDAAAETSNAGARRLNKAELKQMKKILDERRQEVWRNAQKTLGEGIQLDAAELPDDMDLASSEYLQYFNLRLRGREKTYLEKIERALARIDEGTFGLCDECGEPIGLERLRVRPEATLCIRCKEAQEREEQQFG